MKKLIFIATVIFFSTTNIGHTKAMEYEISSQEKYLNKSTVEEIRPVDPIVANDGEEDGLNDQSTVNLKITKISDNPISPLGAGTWDPLGYSDFKSSSKVFYSGGGNIKIYITQPAGAGPDWWYKLYEDDSIDDDLVSSFYLPNQAGTWVVEFNVSSFVDGDNNKAELFLTKLYYPTVTVYTEWWD